MNLRRLVVSLVAAITLCGTLVGGIAYAHGKAPTQATPLVPVCTYTFNKTINSVYKEERLNGAVVDETVSLVGTYDSTYTTYYCGKIAGEYNIYCDYTSGCSGLNVWIEVNGAAATNTQGPTYIAPFGSSDWLSGWYSTMNPGSDTALAHNNNGTIQS